nr:MAG TPA: hypothetical protein [Caudoviricetes sp.]
MPCCRSTHATRLHLFFGFIFGKRQGIVDTFRKNI